MATPLVYRLRIRNAADSADDLIVSSVRGGTNPYLGGPPSGDGQEVDPLTGEVRTGVYTVEVIDAVTGTSGGTSDRVFTAKLFDAEGRQKLLSRRTYVEISETNGSSWSGLIAGYLLNYNLVSGLVWSVQIGDTRRIENTKIVFDGSSVAFALRGCLFGGPIIGGSWGPVNDRGGWRFLVSSIVVVGTNRRVNYEFVSGYRGINDPRTNKLQDALGMAKDAETIPLVQKCTPYYSPNVAPFAMPGFPGLVAYVSGITGAVTEGRFTPAISANVFNQSTSIIIPLVTPRVFALLWPSAITTPTVGDIHSISLFSQVPTDDSPVYLDEHPVDVVTTLWTEAGIAFDATAAAAVRTLLGDTLRVAMRITQSMTLLEFLNNQIFGPFGISARTNSSGDLELFSTRLKQSAIPTTIVTTDDLQGADETLFGNDESTVVSSVRLKTEVYYAYNPNADPTIQNSRPLDSVIVAPNEVVVLNADVSTFSTREISYEMNGMIHDVSGLVADMNTMATSIAEEIFDRFGRGNPVGEFAVIRGSAGDTGTQIGEELYLEPVHLPNLNKRFGDDPAVGARIVQIVRRTETPSGPVFKYSDAGSDQQPVVPAAVITIAANADAPRFVAQFTVTNAAAINATAVLVTAVQWATGGSSPANGVQFARYVPGTTPTAAVQLPAVIPGSKVWVRARTEQDGRRPSAWTAWTSVTLTAIPVVTGETFSGVRFRTAVITWTQTADLTDVYVFQGTVAPADWTPYFVQTFPADTNFVQVDCPPPGGTGTDYIGAIQHRDVVTGKLGPMVTGAFQTVSIFTVTDPPRLEIVNPQPGPFGGALPSGVVLRLFPVFPSMDLKIQRAPDASGVPGAWVDLATVRGSVETYIDYLPLDGALYWYQATHYGVSNSNSSYSAAAQATAQFIPVAIQPAAYTVNASIYMGQTFDALQIAINNLQGAGTIELGANETATIAADLDLPVGVTLRGNNGSTKSIIKGTGTELLNVTGAPTTQRGALIENISFDGVALVLGPTSADYGVGSTIRSIEIKNVSGDALIYRYHSYITLLSDALIHDCTRGVKFDFAAAGSDAGARMNLTNCAIFNVETCVWVDGNTSDGHDIKITDSDLEHATLSAIKYFPNSEGSLFLQNVHFEQNDIYFIDQKGGAIFCDGIWALPDGTTHTAFARIDGDGRLYLTKGRLQWEASKLVQLVHADAKMIIDGDQILTAAAFFGTGGTPMATAGSTAGRVLNGGPGLAGRMVGKIFAGQVNVDTGVIPLSTVGSVTIATMQAFDGAERTIEFDLVVATVAGKTVNTLRVYLNPTGLLFVDLAFPVAAGGGHVKICYTPDGNFSAYGHYNGTFVRGNFTDTNGHTVTRFIDVFSHDGGGFVGTSMAIRNLYEYVH